MSADFPEDHQGLNLINGSIHCWIQSLNGLLEGGGGEASVEEEGN